MNEVSSLKGICLAAFPSQEVFDLFKDLQSMLVNGEMTLGAHITKRTNTTKRPEPPKDSPAIKSIKKARGAQSGGLAKLPKKKKDAGLAKVVFEASNQLTVNAEC